MNTRLILVGGFLGAGKTTLLWEAAKRLAARGLRAGLITNDQAPELVDTAFLSRGGTKVAEVNGSCFCCNFQGLLDAMADVRAEADMLIAEPVGSCTDLSATILQPLKARFRRDLAIAPLTVVTDPLRLADILDGGAAGLHPSAAYIFRKQIEEADIILIHKTDLLTPAELETLTARLKRRHPHPSVFAASAKTGDGIDAWLDEVMRRNDTGLRIVEVDYDIYAEGEAVLGWLNATIALHGTAADWQSFTGRLLENLSRRFDGMGAAVGHVKLMLESGGDFLIGNLTGKGETLSIRGGQPAGKDARLTLNARVEMTPEDLENIVREELAAAAADRITTSTTAWRCLSPGRPNPTYRYDHILSAGEG